MSRPLHFLHSFDRPASFSYVRPLSSLYRASVIDRYFKDAPPNSPLITIRQTDVPESKEAFINDLMSWIIQPNYKKLPIILTWTDAYLELFYDIRPFEKALDDKAQQRVPNDYRPFLPQPYLYMIH